MSMIIPQCLRNPERTAAPPPYDGSVDAEDPEIELLGEFPDG